MLCELHESLKIKKKKKENKYSWNPAMYPDWDPL